jgi:hypothetical protein
MFKTTILAAIAALTMLALTAPAQTVTTSAPFEAKVKIDAQGKITGAPHIVRRLDGPQAAAIKATIKNLPLRPHEDVAPTQGNQGQAPNEECQFPGIIREDNGHINVYVDQVHAGRTISTKTTFNGSNFLTDPNIIDQDATADQGQFVLNMVVPKVIDAWEVIIEAYEMSASNNIISRTQYRYNSSIRPSSMVAAYEIPSTAHSLSGPLITIKIVGTFDPGQPYTVYMGSQKIAKLNNVTVGNSTPRETTFTVGSDVMQNVGSPYPLTVCQFNSCTTVQVQQGVADNSGKA